MKQSLRGHFEIASKDFPADCLNRIKPLDLDFPAYELSLLIPHYCGSSAPFAQN